MINTVKLNSILDDCTESAMKHEHEVTNPPNDRVLEVMLKYPGTWARLKVRSLTIGGEWTMTDKEIYEQWQEIAGIAIAEMSRLNIVPRK